MPSRILAIDPGTTQSAYVLWDGVTAHAKGILPNADLRALLLSRDLAPYDLIACEMIASYGMAVGREVFETCVFIGRLQEIAARQETPFRFVFRKDVKLHLCGSPRAKDANIRQALIDKHGAPGTRKQPGRLFGFNSHLWAALAVADYAVETAEKQTHE